MFDFFQPIPEIPIPDAAGHTKLQIICAAEKLFARHGFNGTSLRQIATAAGQGNNNAVRYHFGTKEALMQAIFRYRAEQMEPIRRQMLERMQAAGATADIRAILDIFYLPHLGLRDEEGRYSYAGFLVHYLLYQRPQGIRHVVDRGELPIMAEVQALYYRRVSFLDPAAAERRLFTTSLTTLSILVHRDNNPTPMSDAELARIYEDALHVSALAVCVPEAPYPRLFHAMPV